MIILEIFLLIVLISISIYLLLNGNEEQEFTMFVFWILVTPLFAFFFIRYMYWNTISNGVEITEKQFPELYQLYIDLTREMGFTENGKLKTPRLYLTNGMGSMNAFASKCTLRRRYITIYSDLLDVAYEHNNFSFIRFVLAHELGHHKCGHTNLWRIMLKGIPIFSKSFIRAQEYTADRVAMYYAEEGALDMIYLFAGKHLGSRVDLEEYFKSIEEHKDSIWLKLSNFLSDHPVGYRRMTTLKKAKEKGWDIHGKML
ncbi:peptidase M48 [Bacillus sp. CDB3]|nr:peptidase M48 [Bacillus sp. CDB3]